MSDANRRARKAWNGGTRETAMAAARQAVLYLRSKLPLGATEALLKDPVLYAELLTKIVEGRQNVPRQ